MLTIKSTIINRCLSASLAVSLLLSLSSCQQTASDGHSETDNLEFESCLSELFCEEIVGNTLNLHYTLNDPAAYGITSYTVTLGDFSKEQRKANEKELKETAKELNKFSYSSLSREQQLNYDILQDYLQTQIALADYELYQEVLAPSSGIHSQLPLLYAEFKFENRQDVEDYLTLLSLTYDYFAQLLEFEKEKAKEGLFMSDELCNQTIEECEDFISNTENHYLKQTFETKLQAVPGLSEAEKNTYLSQNQTILSERLFPAYRLLISGLTSLMGCGRNDWGLCHYDDGKAYYELLVHADTGRSDSVEELFEAIATQRSEDLAACLRLQNENPDILAECAAFEWTTEEPVAMLASLENSILADFPAPPETSYEICYVDPALEEFLAPAFYIVAPIDQYRNHSIYINSAQSYEDIYFFTTLAHEGFPGHLYQNVMSCFYGIEPVRSILNYPGYDEGWATYVEMLSFYYAGLDADVAAMLQHNKAATLSLYASTDIGIHYLGWKQQDIYDFWASFGITNESALEEITSLILAEPGNYLKYYAGYLGFLDLKETMQSTYGEQFQLKEFHRALLEIGPAPFDILEKYFDVYYSDSAE